MKTRKLRINGMDLVILLVLAAAVCLLLYVFVWSDKGEVSQSGEKAEIEYVVELSGLEEQFADRIKEGEPVLDAVLRGSMGAVFGTPESITAERINMDIDSGRLVSSTYPGRVNMYITIRAEADVTEREYSIAGQPVYVGAKLSLLFPGMKCDGYCIKIKAID